MGMLRRGYKIISDVEKAFLAKDKMAVSKTYFGS
jgi:hypothetical protein